MIRRHPVLGHVLLAVGIWTDLVLVAIGLLYLMGSLP